MGGKHGRLGGFCKLVNIALHTWLYYFVQCLILQKSANAQSWPANIVKWTAPYASPASSCRHSPEARCPVSRPAPTPPHHRLRRAPRALWTGRHEEPRPMPDVHKQQAIARHIIARHIINTSLDTSSTTEPLKPHVVLCAVLCTARSAMRSSSKNRAACASAHHQVFGPVPEHASVLLPDTG